jgi:hypothetical protein
VIRNDSPFLALCAKRLRFWRMSRMPTRFMCVRVARSYLASARNRGWFVRDSCPRAQHRRRGSLEGRDATGPCASRSRPGVGARPRKCEVVATSWTIPDGGRDGNLLFDTPMEATDVSLVAGALVAPRAPPRPVAQRDRA